MRERHTEPHHLFFFTITCEAPSHEPHLIVRLEVFHPVFDQIDWPLRPIFHPLYLSENRVRRGSMRSPKPHNIIGCITWRMNLGVQKLMHDHWVIENIFHTNSINTTKTTVQTPRVVTRLSLTAMLRSRIDHIADVYTGYLIDKSDNMLFEQPSTPIVSLINSTTKLMIDTKRGQTWLAALLWWWRTGVSMHCIIYRWTWAYLLWIWTRSIIQNSRWRFREWIN